MSARGSESLLSSVVSTVLLLGLGTGLSALLLGTLVYGRHYYWLPRDARPDDPLDELLAPGEPWGLLLGVIGTVLMLAMLAYTLRKWLPVSLPVGRPAHWLQFHVLCGVLGPLYIVVHTAFLLPHGLISIGFWCMTLVAVSGVFGRYVYGFFPRVAGGRALAFDEAMAKLADLREELVAVTAGASGQLVGQAVAVVSDMEGEARHLFDLVSLRVDLWRRRRRVRALLRRAALPASAERRARDALEDQLALRQGLEASRVARRLFRYWHLFHRPLAAAMYVIVAMHIAFAVLLGGSLARLATLVP